MHGCAWIANMTRWAVAVLAGTLIAGASTAPVDRPLPALHGEALAMDTGRGRAVLVGGRAGDDWFRGTWEWDGAGWREIATAAAGPAPRGGHALAYDPSRRRTVLFGGMVSPPATLLCDTWSYDGAAWTKHDAGDCPTDRVRNAGLVFDTRHRRLLLLDGPAIAGDAPRPLRLWRWSESGWALVDDRGPRRIGFSQAAFDAVRGVLVVPVLFGGPDAGVWEWDGGAWTRHASEGPSVRQTYALAWDTGRRRVLLKGGQATSGGPFLADAWTWTGGRWTRDEAASAIGPPGRGGGVLLDDPGRRQLLYIGGYADGLLIDFWALRRDGWHALAR
jgi:hypothetical protein